MTSTTVNGRTGFNTISFTNAGTYNIQFNLSFASDTTSPSQDQYIYIWLYYNGANVPETTYNTMFLKSSGGSTNYHYYLVSGNWLLQVTSAGGYSARIMWYNDNSNVYNLTPQVSSSIYPAVPSATLTVTQLS